MSTEIPLDGVGRVDLGAGLVLHAPGFGGEVGVVEAAPSTRGASRGPLDEALLRADLNEVKRLELRTHPVPRTRSTSALHTPSGEDALELEVADTGPDVGQVVLAVDDAGVARWCFPLSDEGRPATRGGSSTKRFLIPAEDPIPPAGGATRGVAGALVRRVLKVLAYPIVDRVLGPLGDRFVTSWEAAQRPHRFRRFGPDDKDATGDEGVPDATDWQRLGAGRALLFIHGTFSTARAAFSELPRDVHEVLAARYGGRLLAFDHPTLSVDPESNVRELLRLLPPGVALDVDIVSHSRGGLVTRVLTERATALGDADRLRVGRAVFVGVPNAGTILAEPEHTIATLDRMSSVLGLLPFAGDLLEAILTVVKVVGHAGLVHLDGLASMRPDGPFLARLNAPSEPEADYFAIAADYAPTAGGVTALLRQRLADGLADRIFQHATNDMVVPTEGVAGENGHPRFPLPAQNVLAFPGEHGVMHTSFFSQPETGERLLEWLG